MVMISAFADEFGNNSFDFEKQGTHFIVAAVIVRTDRLPELEAQIDDIRRRHYFQTGELKSSKVGNNHGRRLAVLSSIANLDISIYAVVVDKRKLVGDGFGYKKSFYKFLNRLLYKELFRTYPELDLYVDEHGGKEFIAEFKKYVERHHVIDLFSGSDFSVQKSHSNKFIQLADFVAGSLGYIYDELKKSNRSGVFKRILDRKIVNLNFFPNSYIERPDDITASNVDFNRAIASVSYQRIEDFLSKNAGVDQDRIDQIHFLKLLIWVQRTSRKREFITTKEILEHLNQNRQIDLGTEQFRSNIVAKLRDKGILIASSREGYKIPVSVSDLKLYLDHGVRIILPMLNRIKEARSAIKAATLNELDILKMAEYEELRILLDNSNDAYDPTEEH